MEPTTESQSPPPQPMSSAQLMLHFEEMFSKRFTERDPSYQAHITAQQPQPPPPPCVENWYRAPKRSFDWINKSAPSTTNQQRGGRRGGDAGPSREYYAGMDRGDSSSANQNRGGRDDDRRPNREYNYTDADRSGGGQHPPDSRARRSSPRRDRDYHRHQQHQRSYDRGDAGGRGDRHHRDQRCRDRSDGDRQQRDEKCRDRSDGDRQNRDERCRDDQIRTERSPLHGIPVVTTTAVESADRCRSNVAGDSPVPVVVDSSNGGGLPSSVIAPTEVAAHGSDGCRDATQTLPPTGDVVTDKCGGSDSPVKLTTAPEIAVAPCD